MRRTSSPRLDVDDSLRLLAVQKARSGRTGKKVLGPPPQPTLPAARQAIIERLGRSTGCLWLAADRQGKVDVDGAGE